MEKKLAIIGNSLALIIDKPLRRLLALGPERLVRVTFDGRRLIVEPIDAVVSMRREKKLAIVGNSLALIIDKPLRRLLALGPERLVRVSLDGRRLVVEPIDAKRPAAPSSHVEQRREALTVFRELLNTYGFGNLQWSRLAPRLRVTRYISQLETAFADPAVAPDETLMATIRRFEQCHTFLRAGHTCDQAIDAALARCPIPVEAGQPAATAPLEHEVGAAATRYDAVIAAAITAL